MLLGGSALVGPDHARLLFAGLLTAYELVFGSRLGQTPGQDLLHVKVAVAGTAEAPGLVRAARRWAVPLAAVLWADARVGAALLVVTAALALVVPGRRSGHDLLAGTWVIAYDADADEEGDEPVDFAPLDDLRRQRRLFRDED